MANIELQADGLDALLANLRGMVNGLPQTVGVALKQWGDQVLEVSKDRTPVDTGALVASGYVTEPEIGDGQISITLGYGGDGVDYALKVHEDMDPRTHWSKAGTGPQYLAQPAREAQDQLPGMVADAVRVLVGA